jgi:hypothetical protein
LTTLAGRCVRSSCAITIPEVVIARERERGMEILDRRNWR